MGSSCFHASRTKDPIWRRDNWFKYFNIHKDYPLSPARGSHWVGLLRKNTGSVPPGQAEEPGSLGLVRIQNPTPSCMLGKQWPRRFPYREHEQYEWPILHNGGRMLINEYNL